MLGFDAVSWNQLIAAGGEWRVALPRREAWYFWWKTLSVQVLSFRRLGVRIVGNIRIDFYITEKWHHRRHANNNNIVKKK